MDLDQRECSTLIMLSPLAIPPSWDWLSASCWSSSSSAVAASVPPPAVSGTVSKRWHFFILLVEIRNFPTQTRNTKTLMRFLKNNIPLLHKLNIFFPWVRLARLYFMFDTEAGSFSVSWLWCVCIIVFLQMYSLCCCCCCGGGSSRERGPRYSLTEVRNINQSAALRLLEIRRQICWDHDINTPAFSCHR